MAEIIYTSGERKSIEPKNGRDFKLDELQDIVGGYIEIVRLNGNKILVVNEEGMLNELDPNFEAMSLYGGFLVGDVLYCDSDQVR